MSIYPDKINSNSSKLTQKFILLFAILIIGGVGAILRFHQLDSLVPALNRDEAALGYNALLLSQVGVDEWSEPWQFTLRSFGDYKLIGYPALLVSLFKMIEANDFFVRIPSVLAGVGIILISYPLAKVFKLSKIASLLFTLVIALVPFAIFYSRFAYEANVALFYVLTAIWMLLLSVKKNATVSHATPKLSGLVSSNSSYAKRTLIDIFSIFLLVLACFTYNSPLILFLPILFIVAISRIKDGWQSWLPLLILGVTAWLGVVWAIYPVITQKSGISLMTDPLVASQYSVYRQNIPNVLLPLIGNQYFYWAKISTENIFKSISADFLVTKIFHPWHGIPGRGQLLWPVAMMGWVGFFWLLVRLGIDSWRGFVRSNNFSFGHFFADQKFILLALLLISLIPAVITVDAPHATRSLLFLYLFCLISVWGVDQMTFVINRFVIGKQKKEIIQYSLAAVFAILIVTSASMYIQDLYSRYRIESKSIFQAGIVDIIEQLPAEGRVAVLDPEGYDYIRWAWYSKMSPEEFLSTIERRPPSVAGLRYGEQVGRFHMIDQASNRRPNDINLVQWSEAKASWEVLP